MACSVDRINNYVPLCPRLASNALCWTRAIATSLLCFLVHLVISTLLEVEAGAYAQTPLCICIYSRRFYADLIRSNLVETLSFRVRVAFGQCDLRSLSTLQAEAQGLRRLGLTDHRQ